MAWATSNCSNRSLRGGRPRAARAAFRSGRPAWKKRPAHLADHGVHGPFLVAGRREHAGPERRRAGHRRQRPDVGGQQGQGQAPGLRRRHRAQQQLLRDDHIRREGVDRRQRIVGVGEGGAGHHPLEQPLDHRQRIVGLVILQAVVVAGLAGLEGRGRPRAERHAQGGGVGRVARVAQRQHGMAAGRQVAGDQQHGLHVAAAFPGGEEKPRHQNPRPHSHRLPTRSDRALP
jgi:hypothetical protein